MKMGELSLMKDIWTQEKQAIVESPSVPSIKKSPITKMEV